MSEAAQYDLPTLLEKAGARPRGNRCDCPKCGGHRTITHSDETFFCHKCQWKGNTVTLAKEVGVYQPLSPEKYRELQQLLEQADRAARALYCRVKARRLQVAAQLRSLGRIERGAHAAPNHPLAWDALAMVYSERPALLAELAAMENCKARDLFRFLTTDDATRVRALARVVVRGGLYDHADRFVEVEA